MGHVDGESRYQRLLLAPSLDEVVDAAHPVRVIDAFIDALDLGALGFSKVVAEATGRPPYRPGDLLKLYVYGYAQQMRSSRRLEREALRNIEVHWLVNRVSPSFKTIADFRKDHAAAIMGVTRAFVQFCRTQQLYDGVLVAIDGSKVEAVASRKKVITPKSLEKQLAGLESKIAAYLAAMDEADRAEGSAEAGPGDVAAALEVLRVQREEVRAQAKALADKGLSQRVVGEEDARLMKTARHGHQVAYNAQTAVDAKHGLVAAFDLVNEGNDQRQLLPMAEAAQEALEAEALTAVADKGYSSGEQGEACRALGITAVVPRQKTVNTKNQALFSRDAFTYDVDSDSWTCPAKETLALTGIDRVQQKKLYTAKACAGCALKPQCTDAKKGRLIVRHFYEDAREAMHQRALMDRTAMKHRRELVEHPFGIMKWMMGYPRFLVRGLEKAKSELALTVLGFNMTRAVTILGVPALLEALQPGPA